ISNYSDYQLTGYSFLHADSFRMPLYPGFMACIYFITGVKPYLVIFIQILLSLFSVVFVYRICRLLFDKIEIAKISSFLFALDIHSAFVANQLLTDTLFVVLFSGSIYFLIKGIKTGKLQDILWSAVFMGFAGLTRPVVLFYPAIILLLLLFSKQLSNWKFKAALCFIVVFFGMVGIWPVRNYEKYGQFKFTTEEGTGLLMYYAAYADARTTYRNIDSVRVQYQKEADSMGFRTERNIFKQSEIYKTLGLDYIVKHKVAYIKTHLLGGLNMFFAVGNVGMSKVLGWDENKLEEKFAEISSDRILGNFTTHKRESVLGIFILLILALEYIGALIGCIFLIKNKQYLFLLLFLLTAAYYTTVTGVVGTYRYKLAVIPFICIAAGYGYEHLMKNKRVSTAQK
ncbi:MAG TPA: glycosyltransferase family 39 protein, partial [Bacteroidia bacterium]|nr:glycosyltransferase family 39 protein [Bacteroidia bacterium]